MKKIYLLALVLFSSVIYSQTKGITYQAVILNPEGQHIPGFNNERTPLANTAICLRFSIYKEGVLEYQETKNTITDEFGMVNVIIGSGVYVGGTSTTLAGVNWDGNAKNLVVEVDSKGICTNFIEISNQPFAYVPYAFYAENSGTPGPQGPQGQQGPQGVSGPQGPQGPAGTSGLPGATGPAGPQGAQGIAGPTGATGPQGLQGVVGANGKNTLINTAVEPSGINCANGGTKIEVGLDSNSNGILDSTEINTNLTKYVCNGSNNSIGSIGSPSFSIVNQLYNNNAGFISASGFFNPSNYPFQIVHTYNNLNAIEFEFNSIRDYGYRCFSVDVNLKFYDINNNLVNVLFIDKEIYQTFNSTSGWTNEAPIITTSNSTNTTITLRASYYQSYSSQEKILERNLKIKAQTRVAKVEVIFTTSNVYAPTTTEAGVTCSQAWLNGPNDPYGAYFGDVTYSLISFE